MADFCFQCTLDVMWGPPPGDFAHYGERGKITEEEVASGLGIPVLCEGCGPTRVDHKGRCIDNNCGSVGHKDEATLRSVAAAERWLERRSGRLAWLYTRWDTFAGTPWWPGALHYWRLNTRSFWQSRHKCRVCGERWCKSVDHEFDTDFAELTGGGL